MIRSLSGFLVVLVGLQAGSLAPMAEAQSILAVEGAAVTLIDEVEVPAREPSVLMNLNVKEGDSVEAGQVIGRLEDRQAEIEVNKADAELDVRRAEAENKVNLEFAKASYDVAVAEMRRMEDAIRSLPKAVSDTEVDRQRLTVIKTDLQIDQAEHEGNIAQMSTKLHEVLKDAAEEKLSRHEIVAPITGMVVERYTRPGQWVSPGDSVVRIIRLDKLRVEGVISDKYLDREALTGRPVVLTVDLPGRGKTQFSGEITFVKPEVRPVNRTITIWAEVENPELLLSPGQRGNLEIDIAGTRLEAIAKGEAAGN